MVPVIASRGASFRGAFSYYFHDKNAWTTERILWTKTLNLMTDCVEKAWRFMAYTAKHQAQLKLASGQRMSGAKMQKPVFSYSLSWHPEQIPTKQAMLEAATESLHLLGLSEHQTIIAAHADEPHPHVHIIVNVVHPLTGLVAKLKNTKRCLSKFALNYEREDGKIYCTEREKNNTKTKPQPKDQIQRKSSAIHPSDVTLIEKRYQKRMEVRSAELETQFRIAEKQNEITRISESLRHFSFFQKLFGIYQFKKHKLKLLQIDLSSARRCVFIELKKLEKEKHSLITEYENSRNQGRSKFARHFDTKPSRKRFDVVAHPML